MNRRGINYKPSVNPLPLPTPPFYETSGFYEGYNMSIGPRSATARLTYYLSSLLYSASDLKRTRRDIVPASKIKNFRFDHATETTSYVRLR